MVLQFALHLEWYECNTFTLICLFIKLCVFFLFSSEIDLLFVFLERIHRFGMDMIGDWRCFVTSSALFIRALDEQDMCYGACAVFASHMT